MNVAAACQWIAEPSTERPSGIRHVSDVRSQAAFVRALLDELERVVPPGAEAEVDQQLVEELARLGCRCIEIASTLGPVVDARESALSAGSQTPGPARPR